MNTPNIKTEAHQLVESLPENSTWDDLMYKIYVRQSIESGLKDGKDEKTTIVHDVRKKYGLSE
ncbi:MAG: hypothetical protein HYV29_00970 [Ignavibacteriales bacterium]|nr:hypothetical protein [Ignavibacteriales bacterium]